MKKAAPKRFHHRALDYLRCHARVILGVLLVAIFIHDIFGPHGLLAIRRQQKEVEKLRQEIQKVNEENQSLAGQVKALKTAPQAIERIAREEMGLARPGELIFKLPPKPPEAKAAQAEKK